MEAIRINENPPFADTPQWRAQLRNANKAGVVYWHGGDKYEAMLVLARFEDDRHPKEERYLITLTLSKQWMTP